jgi:hypothetical protein
LGTWSADRLQHLSALHELEIAVPRADGTPGAPTPIWVVVVGSDVFVRTWQRRTTGWYGRAVRGSRARVAVAGERVDVVVTQVGDRSARAVDDAYRSKYGAAGAQSMVTAEAVASTLRLSPSA